jgi:hypothetical protein
MAFTNDNLNVGGFVNDTTATHNVNFAVDQYTKYIAQDYTADNTFKYYGNDNDFGFMYNTADAELNMYSGDNKLLEITKQGAVTFTCKAGTGIDAFKIKDTNGTTLFGVNTDGDFNLGSVLEMSEYTPASLPDIDAHGMVFYDSNLYAKV